MTVRVTFKFDPDEVDEDDETGMTEGEFDQLIDAVAGLGGYDVEAERVVE